MTSAIAVLRDILRGAPDARVAVCVMLPDGSIPMRLHQDSSFYAASTMKVALAVTVARLIDQSVLARTVQVRPRYASQCGHSEFAVPDEDADAELLAMTGQFVTVTALMRRMLTLSSNDATNHLLELCGVSAIQAVLRDCGCANSTVQRGISDAAARDAGLDNRVTTRDLAQILMRVATRSAASLEKCQLIEQALHTAADRELIPAGLPPHTYAATKIGRTSTVTHDAAIIRPPIGRVYTLAICTSGLTEQTATHLIRAITAQVHGQLTA